MAKGTFLQKIRQSLIYPGPCQNTTLNNLEFKCILRGLSLPALPKSIHKGEWIPNPHIVPTLLLLFPALGTLLQEQCVDWCPPPPF